jgi:anthranilate synthase component 2
MELISAAAETVPIFGVCLGHQSIGEAFGGDVIRAPLPIHGKMATILHHGDAVFRGIGEPFQATRYHSLIVSRDTLPNCLRITAETPDGLIMALSHKILQNFLDLAREWNEGPRRREKAA